MEREVAFRVVARFRGCLKTDLTSFGIRVAIGRAVAYEGESAVVVEEEMSYEIRADYSRSWLFPPHLEDWVGEDHPARFVRELVDALDVAAAGFHSRTSEDGRPNFAADLLLKVWLYGYVNGIRSLRKLERACRENVGLLWLTGLNEPDHNTLWRFWRDNRSALRQVFKLVVRTAVNAQLVGVVLHAIDGTKILAQGSKDRVRTREQVEASLARIDEAVEEVMEQIEAAVAADQESEGYRLPPEWRQRMVRRDDEDEGEPAQRPELDAAGAGVHGAGDADRQIDLAGDERLPRSGEHVAA